MAEAIGPDEFSALTQHLKQGLAAAIVDNARYRFPDFDGQGFLRVADATLQLRGTDLASLRFGSDGHGPWLVSALSGGFSEFRVEVQGVVVADLAWGLNARLGVDDEGRTTVTSRLDPLLTLDQAVLYDPQANVLISQRARGGPAAEQRFPLRIPFRR